jgi:general secretion pathway protein A
MYESFYGLKEKPFELLPDPSYLFMSASHENAFTHLEYAVAENKGFVVISGEIGSGKTTLINYLLDRIQPDLIAGLINSPNVTPGQFIKMMCREYELDVTGYNKADSLMLFNFFLIDQYAVGKRVILIVDEAQNISPATMEEIRMLSNLETEKHHLLQIILVGQPQLKETLRREDLVQFAQRVTVHCHLDGLSDDEVQNYIQYRLQIGGANNPDLFHPEAIASISEYSRGIPRLINILCDTALVFGFSDGAEIIDKKTIEDVIKNRDDGEIFSVHEKKKKKSPVLEKQAAHSLAPVVGDNSNESMKMLRRIGDQTESIAITLDKIERSLRKLISE